MEIKLICKGQKIYRDPADTQEIVANSRGMLTARVEYDSTWLSLSRIILWTNGATCVGTIDLRGAVEIPWEVLKAGKLSVSVVGLGAIGKPRLVTKEMETPLQVEPSGATEGADPEEATPTMVEQMTALVTAALQKMAGVDTALAAAVDAASRAEAAADRAANSLQAILDAMTPSVGDASGETEKMPDEAGDEPLSGEGVPEEGEQDPSDAPEEV